MHAVRTLRSLLLLLRNLRGVRARVGPVGRNEPRQQANAKNAKCDSHLGMHALLLAEMVSKTRMRISNLLAGGGVALSVEHIFLHGMRSEVR